MASKRTIEARTAEAILQTPVNITIGGHTYVVEPPTCATLIEVSKRIPEIPYMDTFGDVLNEVLASARDSRPIFEIIAVLILGAKVLRKDARRLLRKTRLDTLTDEITLNCTPSEVHRAFRTLTGMMEVEDFFALSASLQEIGLIQTTRGAGLAETTTASGL